MKPRRTKAHGWRLASLSIWGSKQLPEVRRNLALIANTIGAYEPVSMLVRPSEIALARSLVSSAVRLIPFQMDDIWMRDTGPVFLTDGFGAHGGINFNFNGWGNKQTHAPRCARGRFCQRPIWRNRTAHIHCDGRRGD